MWMKEDQGKYIGRQLKMHVVLCKVSFQKTREIVRYPFSAWRCFTLEMVIPPFSRIYVSDDLTICVYSIVSLMCIIISIFLAFGSYEATSPASWMDNSSSSTTVPRPSRITKKRVPCNLKIEYTHESEPSPLQTQSGSALSPKINLDVPPDSPIITALIQRIAEKVEERTQERLKQIESKGAKKRSIPKEVTKNSQRGTKDKTAQDCGSVTNRIYGVHVQDSSVHNGKPLISTIKSTSSNKSTLDNSCDTLRMPPPARPPRYHTRSTVNPPSEGGFHTPISDCSAPINNVNSSSSLNKGPSTHEANKIPPVVDISVPNSGSTSGRPYVLRSNNSLKRKPPDYDVTFHSPSLSAAIPSRNPRTQFTSSSILHSTAQVQVQVSQNPTSHHLGGMAHGLPVLGMRRPSNSQFLTLSSYDLPNSLPIKTKQFKTPFARTPVSKKDRPQGRGVRGPSAMYVTQAERSNSQQSSTSSGSVSSSGLGSIMSSRSGVSGASSCSAVPSSIADLSQLKSPAPGPDSEESSSSRVLGLKTPIDSHEDIEGDNIGSEKRDTRSSSPSIDGDTSFSSGDFDMGIDADELEKICSKYD